MVVIVLLTTMSVLPVRSRPIQFVNVTSEQQFDYYGKSGEISPPLDPSFLDNEGVYVADVNNDQWADILALGGNRPALFRNQDGTFHRSESFPDLDKKINAATFVDVDTDGYRDLVLVPQSGRLILLKNNGGQFTSTHVLNKPAITAGVGVFSGDFNRDACPDLFVLQFGQRASKAPNMLKRYRRNRKFWDFETDNGTRNFLLIGDCKGNFSVSRSPALNRTHWSLAGSAVDVNNDGHMDIHVANDFYQDSLYINRGDGRFNHKYLGRPTNRNGMSSEILDVNQDGRPDIMVSNIFLRRHSDIFNRSYFHSILPEPYGHNMLVNKGKTRFEDQAERYNLQRGGWGWAISADDFDNDFQQEIVQVTQNLLGVKNVLINLFARETPILRFIRSYFGDATIPTATKETYRYYNEFRHWVGYPNVWNRKKTSSKRYTHRLGDAVGFKRLNARGVSSLDFDRDGDLDLVVSQYAGQFQLYENVSQPPEENRPLKIEIKNPEFGGEIVLKTDNRKQILHITSRSDFASQEPAIYTVGLGDRKTLQSLSVKRHSFGKRSRETIPATARITITNNGISIEP
jgi:hypothetical protein